MGYLDMNPPNCEAKEEIIPVYILTEISVLPGETDQFFLAKKNIDEYTDINELKQEILTLIKQSKW